ncbi:MAG TPA: Ig-like domain-containing protein [Solirubrobacterales bacterium]|nr:Ig-like domain-containing protein [Solirubrobacterales bacterium]
MGRGAARFARWTAGAVACLSVLGLAPAGAGGATPMAITAPLECGPFAAGASASAARLAAGSPLAAEPHVEAAYQRALARRAQPATRAAGSLRQPTGTVRIPVYVHVIQNGTTGNVSDQQVTDQIAVLNDSFNGGSVGGAASSYVFDHVSTDRTDNADWHNMSHGGADETAAKNALHEGGRRALNLYTVSAGSDLLGWATFPDEYAARPSQDGVVVDYRSLPGGSGSPYNLGDTATHEVGHWLGLFHTFSGGCGTAGDLVADTPAERNPHYGPCAVVDSCPTLPGNDPVENFMDYSDDVCMDRFTAGQVARMDGQVAAYRNTTPVANNVSTSAEADASVPVTLPATDADGDALTYEIADQPDHGSLTGSGAERTYTPAAGFGGTDSFTYRVTDVFGATATGTVTIAVAEPPPPPPPPPQSSDSGQPEPGSGDTTVALEFTASKRQKLRALTVSAGCRGESCAVVISGKVKARPPERGKAVTFKLKEAAAQATGGGPATLSLTPQKRAKLARLLGRGCRATARLTVTGRDAAGNTASEAAAIKVRG